ncbi:MAG: hypothetical protein JWN86_1479 [Planctomycetota bacterium]|nr:hypothetical protein [Planctomycetota bacterium]
MKLSRGRRRWTIAGMMILVALVAVPLGIERHVRRERAMREVAARDKILRTLDASIVLTAFQQPAGYFEYAKHDLSPLHDDAVVPSQPAEIPPFHPLDIWPKLPEDPAFHHLGTWPSSPDDRPFRPLGVWPEPR